MSTESDHTTVSLTEPEVCACGQPIHQGSTWVSANPRVF